MNVRISVIMITLLSILGSNVIFAQDKLLSERKLKKQKTFTNLQEAMANPEKVYKLKLSNPKKILKEIPAEVFQFKNLQELDISTNQIKKLPDELFKLLNLQVLDVSFNQIQEIPSAIGQLKNLQSLICKGCRLTKLPVEVAKLQQLHTLDVFANRIKTFPLEMSKLTNIRTINILRNGMTAEEKKKIKALFPNATFVER